MVKKTSLIITMVALCTFLASCGNVKEIYQNILGGQVETNTKNRMSADVKEKAYNEKFTAYVSLDIFITGRLERALGFYFSEYGNDENIKVNKNSNLYPGVFLELNKREVEKNLSYLTKGPSFGAVDDSVKELQPKLIQLINSLSEADSYYKMKSYIDDDFVKGKVLHKQIYSQYAEVEPLAKKFSSDFSSVFLNKSKQDLESFKRNDFMIRYYSLSTIIRAKDIEKELRDENITSENVTDLDIGKFKEKYNLLVEDVNKFIECCNDDVRIKKENVESIDDSSSNLRTCILELKAAATDILISAQQDKKVNTGSFKDSYEDDGKSRTIEYYSKKIKDVLLEYIKI